MSSLDNRHLNHGFVTGSGHLPKVIEKEEMWEEEKGDRVQLILCLSLVPHKSMGYYEHSIFLLSTSPLVFGASLGLCFLHGQVFLSCTTTLEARMKTFLGSFLASKLPSQFLLPPQCWEKDKLFVGKPGKTPHMLIMSLQRPPTMSSSTARYSYYMKLTSRHLWCRADGANSCPAEGCNFPASLWVKEARMTSIVNGICENTVWSTSKSWSLITLFLPSYRRNVEGFTSRGENAKAALKGAGACVSWRGPPSNELFCVKSDWGG